MLQVFIEHLSARHCFCIWACWQIRNEKQRSKTDHPFPLGGKIQVPGRSILEAALVTPSLEKLSQMKLFLWLCANLGTAEMPPLTAFSALHVIFNLSEY